MSARGKAAVPPTGEAGELQYLDPAELTESSLHVRSAWGDMESLEKSIRRNGVLEPIIARPVGRGRKKKIEIIAGVRRRRAAVAAQAPKVPVLVRAMTDEAAVEAQLDENLCRQDLHPMDEAELYELAVKHKRRIETLAAERGVTPAHVRQRLQLCRLTPEMRDRYRDGKIANAVAFACSRIPEELQAQACEDMSRLIEPADGGGEMRDRQRALWALRDKYILRLASAPFDVNDETLVPSAGACGTCPHRSDRQQALFPELAATDAYCLKPSCYASKRDALWERTRAEAEAEGVEVLEDVHSARHPEFVAENLKAVWHEGTGVSYKEVAEELGVKPRRVLGRDRDGAPVWLIDEEEAERIAVEYEEKHREPLAIGQPSSSGQPSPTPEQTVAQRMAQAARRAEVLDVAYAELAKAQPREAALWPAIAGCLARILDDVVYVMADARKLDVDDDEGDALIATCKNTDEFRALALEMLARGVDDSRDDWEPELAQLMAACGVSLEAIEKRLSETKGKKKKTSKKGRS